MTTYPPEKSACAFCAIADTESGARLVLRTPEVVAFLPDVPAVLGHVLVIPRKHVADIWALDPPTSRVLAEAVLRVAGAVRSATGAEGLNVIQSNGDAAGQTVFHLHVHVVPRTHGDRMPALWPADAEWSREELSAVQERLRANLATTTAD